MINEDSLVFSVYIDSSGVGASCVTCEDELHSVLTQILGSCAQSLQSLLISLYLGLAWETNGFLFCLEER